MIISDEQARLAAQSLQGASHTPSSRHPEISPELMARVMAAVRDCPETRDERVAEAMHHLDAGNPDSHQVASKMISRIISDSLR